MTDVFEPGVKPMGPEAVEGVASDIVLRLTGCDPAFVFERLDPRTRVAQQTYVGFAGSAKEFFDASPDEVFAALRTQIAGDTGGGSDLPPGAGGGVLALLGYDLLAGSRHPGDKGETPDAVLFKPELLVTVDHLASRAWLSGARDIANRTDIRDALSGRGEALTDSSGPKHKPEWTPVTSEAQFVEFAKRVQADMGPGKPVEGAVLSVKQHTPDRCDPLAAYRKLRAINPSSYMFLARAPSIDAWGATSLGMVRLVDGAFLAETDGATRPYENESFVWTPSAKEITEYDVVTDALREALAPLVDADGLTLEAELEERRFFKLAHLFSAFSARLAPERDGLDLVRALSPHGGAVGHHRQPALDAIAGAETAPRGTFAGTIAFFGTDGSVDASAFIRSMWQTEEGMFVHAGAKVVLASVPEEEYRECILKTLALRQCVE